MIDPPHDRIADALVRLGTVIRSHEIQRTQSEGLSPLQARALVVVRRRSRIRIGQLARELMVTDGTLSAAVSTLEEKDLVRKVSDPEEHRAVNLELTRRGAALAKQAEGWAGEQLATAVDDWEPRESAALLGQLLRLILAFERRGTIAATRMCLTCRYFEPGGGSGSRQHFCRLLGEPIGELDLRVECPDHEPAPPDRLEELRQRL